MGVPKFFRWISERYPLCSQLIQPNKIPEFDNLYLDMNGIIHNCSHPSDDVHFRLTEDQIFLSIFNYIDHIFSKIRPKKLLFMAIDGVAPRAKMNQQRARRFRTAKDAEDRRKAAAAKGEELPKEPPFDSNCITPGTEFMCKFSEQLKYFVAKKITEDSAWQGVKIILSGHEVPGEGEHKIMEYIRLEKSRPDYHPNIRHCLYGLDADLVMLGLLSHEPHFALLREEVTFGRTSKKNSGNPETQNFYLMHLSLFREYLDLEFSFLRENMKDKYNLERVIDDFIVMGFFVGNDFLPNLPGLHINEGALAYMFRLYKELMLEIGAYLHDYGVLNLKACEKLFAKLAEKEKMDFEEDFADMEWLKQKGLDVQHQLQSAKKVNVTITASQKMMFEKIKHFALEGKSEDRLILNESYPARDRHFISKLANELGLSVDTLVSPTADVPTHEIAIYWEEDEDEEDEESNEARARVLRKYDRATVIELEEPVSPTSIDKANLIEQEFVNWRKEYYKEKLEIDFHNAAQMNKLVFHYVEGLQWVLFYYYHGVKSWEWFFPYHYAPKISDLLNISNLSFNFDKGKPLKPFEQLMGVLPAASQSLIPSALRDLMTDPNSPIIHFYPVDFECDMNGKKADWEAIVKIPFIDELRLLKVMSEREKFLTNEEKARNSFGDSILFQFYGKKVYRYPSSFPGVFPDIPNCTCQISVFHLPLMGDDGFKHDLCDGALLGAKSLPGFPSIQSLPHTASLGLHGVRLFNNESKNESIIISLDNQFEGQSPEKLAKQFVGKSVYFEWPFLQEAKCIALVDEYFRYEVVRDSISGRVDVVKTNLTEEQQDKFYKAADDIDKTYSNRKGTIIGPIELVAILRPLEGMTLADDGALMKSFDNRWTHVAIQTLVSSVETEDPRFIEKAAPPLEEDFPIGSNLFFLGSVDFGSPAEVHGYNDNKLDLKLIKPAESELQQEFFFTRKLVQEYESKEKYLPSYVVAKKLNLNGLALSKLTSSCYCIRKDTEEKFNIGLNLKFDGKQKKVLGYSRKSSNGWEYSEKALDLLLSYKKQCPEIFRFLESNAKKDFFVDVDFFPQDPKGGIQRVLQWLESEKVKEFDRVPLETVALEKDVSKAIENAIDDQYRTISGPPKFDQVFINKVPRQAVLKPVHAPHRLSSQTFELGERVIHVLNSGSVPLAAKGTVVGMDSGCLEILFDQTFMSGSDLNGRCSPYRGMTLKADAVLNLSRPQVFTVPLAQNRSGFSKKDPSFTTERRQDNSLYFKSSPMKQEQMKIESNYVQNSSSAPKKNAWQNRPNTAAASSSTIAGIKGAVVNVAATDQLRALITGRPSSATATHTNTSSSVQMKTTNGINNNNNVASKVQIVRKSSGQGSPPSTSMTTKATNNDLNVLTQDLKSLLQIGGASNQKLESSTTTAKVSAAQQLLSNLIPDVSSPSINVVSQQQGMPSASARPNTKYNHNHTGGGNQSVVILKKKPTSFASAVYGQQEEVGDNSEDTQKNSDGQQNRSNYHHGRDGRGGRGNRRGRGGSRN